MRIEVVPYKGIQRRCYEELIGAALELAKTRRIQEMAKWSWARFSRWIQSHPFEADTGCKNAPCAPDCTPPQRMRRFPPTMNCWERVLHQLAWFAARETDYVTLYDHDTLVGRHIEVIVPPTTYLGASATLPARAIANGASEQALAGVLGGLQGGLAGAGMGASAGPYGALAGFILGAGLGAAKGALAPEAAAPAPVAAPAPPSPAPVTPSAVVPLATQLPAAVAKTQPSPRKAVKPKKARRSKR